MIQDFKVVGLLCGPNEMPGSIRAKCFACRRHVYAPQGSGGDIIEQYRSNVLLTPYCGCCALRLDGDMQLVTPCRQCGRWTHMTAEELRLRVGERFLKEMGEAGLRLFAALLAEPLGG